MIPHRSVAQRLLHSLRSSVAGENLPFAIGLFLVVVEFHRVAHGFFSVGGPIGPDYGLMLPLLLAGDYWLVQNGLTAAPWFVPSWCGGQPYLADPASFYYSVPQALTRVVDPVKASYLTALLFAAIGFVGFYFLMRRSFASGRAAATIAGVLFGLNGFYFHRMLIGHLTYHGIMLAPFLALFLTYDWKRDRRSELATDVLGGLIIAYWFYCGMAMLMLPAIMAVAALVCLRNLAMGSTPRLATRLVVTGLISLGLCAAKLVPVMGLLGNFPRSLYPMPGIAGTFSTIKIAFLSLFVSPPNIAEIAGDDLVNSAFPMERHEFEYGVTWVPLALMAVAIAAWLWRRVQGGSLRSEVNPAPINAGEPLQRRHRLGRATWWAALIALIVLPIALNVYTPDWNALLKRIPIIASSSNLFRCFFTYVPLTIAVTALAVDRMAPRRIQMGVATAAAIVVTMLHASVDRQHYRDQPYYPVNIVNGYRAMRSGAAVPSIHDIGLMVDNRGQLVVGGNRNDLLVAGVSQLMCYYPMFGYRLEQFPLKETHLGSVTDVRDGRLNLKDPACYVYPDENDCSPGDEFTISRKAELLKFADYRPYDFKVPARHVAADIVTAIASALSLCVLLLALMRRVRLRLAKSE